MILTLLVVYLLLTAIVLRLYAVAPHGREDKTGFHYTALPSQSAQSADLLISPPPLCEICAICGSPLLPAPSADHPLPPPEN